MVSSAGARAPAAAPVPSDLLAQILDEVREGVMLVGQQGRLVLANRAARRLLAGGGPIDLRSGRVRCRDQASDRLLHRAIEQACAGEGEHREAVVLSQAGGIPLIVTVSCTRAPGHAGQALLLAFDPYPDGDGLTASLRTCFGLTPSEAEVAGAVAEGRAVTDIARRRQVAVGTIRSQLKRIAAKLGCTRQSQIAAIVNAVPPLPAPPSSSGRSGKPAILTSPVN